MDKIYTLLANTMHEVQYTYWQMLKIYVAYTYHEINRHCAA